MKKYIIILAAVILILALAVVLLLVFGGNARRTADDPDCRFTYTFTEKKQDILITVKGKPDKDYAWTVVTDGLNSVSVTQTSSGSKKSAFLVSPVSEGVDEVRLALCRPGDKPDCVYTISVIFSVGTDKKLNVVGYRHAEYGGLTTVTLEDGRQMTYSSDTDGSLHLYIHGAGGETWETSADRKGLIAVSREDGGEDAHIVLSAAAEGSVVMTLNSVGSETAIRLQVTAEDTGAVLVTGYSVGPYNARQEEIERELKEVERTYGKVTLPDGAFLRDVRKMTIKDENGMPRSPVSLFFDADGVSWQYVMLYPAQRTTLEAFYSPDAKSVEAASVNGREAVVICSETEYEDSDEEEDGPTVVIHTDIVTVVWTNQNFCCCAVRGENVTAEQALAMAACMSELNPDAGLSDGYDGAQ